MINKRLQIIVPTLNRVKEVTDNISWLISFFEREDANLNFEVEILVSENSSDHKLSDIVISRFVARASKIGVIMTHIDRAERMSLGLHMNTLMKECNAKWQLWCGDDDLISYEYLSYCLKVTSNDSDRLFYAPGFTACTQEEFFSVAKSKEPSNAKLIFNNKSNSLNEEELEEAYCYKRGHQLSGLLIKSSLINDCLPHMNPNNIYPWITFSVEAVILKKAWISKDVGVIVTTGTPKLFSYGKDGLLPDISEAIKSAPSIKNRMKIHSRIMCDEDAVWWRIRMTSATNIGRMISIVKLSFDEHIGFNLSLRILSRFLYSITMQFLSKSKRKLIRVIR